MKGDFSRFTHNPFGDYTAVLKQQGRADLDSDWNEQSAITAERLRRLTLDLIGEFAVPLAPNEIIADNSTALQIGGLTSGPGSVVDFTIGRGLVYAGGLPLRFAEDITYRDQPGYPEPESLPASGNLLVYLESWEKTVTFIDDESIREPALGGPDTCLRLKAIGQVKALIAGEIRSGTEALTLLKDNPPPTNVQMTMQIDQSALQIPMSFGEIDSGAGAIPGNLHYRIELHDGITSEGTVEEGFKWSDENAAVAVPIIKAIDHRTIMASEPEELASESFKPGDWVEISNIITELHGRGGQMAQVENLEGSDGGLTVTLDRDIYPLLARKKNGDHAGLEGGLGPRLRRWSGYFVPLALKHVYNLGRGVKVTFATGGKKAILVPGDYWTFAIRDRAYNKRFAPQKALPHGVRKHRFPLAIIVRDEKGKAREIIDCRRFLKPLAG
jgi:Family of unknown function (DUF6519)